MPGHVTLATLMGAGPWPPRGIAFTSVSLFSFRSVGPPSYLYSPECVEGKFCELRLYGVLRSSLPRCCIPEAQNAQFDQIPHTRGPNNAPAGSRRALEGSIMFQARGLRRGTM